MQLVATAVLKAAAAPLLASSGSSIFSPIAKPIADVLAAFYAVIPNYGVAIMMLSVAWMIIIAPLTLKSTRSMLAMQKLQPQLKKLQAELKNDRQAFAAAQMELFKEHNVSPFGSCLPTLLPLPVFFALFRVIDGLSHHVKVKGVSVASPSFLSPHTEMYKAIVKAHGHINAFGLDLSQNALSGHSSFAAAVPFYVLLLIMIGTQYLQTSQMMSRNPAANDNPQMKMMKYLPIFFGVVCVRFPAGVILYYAMSNICRMAQQTAMYRYDPKVKALVVQEGAAVEAMTHDIDRKTGGAKAKKPADTPPARNSRFRDALAQASKQAADGKAKKAAESGTQTGKTKPGAAARPGPGNRPAPTTKRPAGIAPKGTAATPPQPAKARTRPPGTGAKPGANGNGASEAKPGVSRNAATAPKKAPTPNGNGSTAKSPPTSNGNGNGVTKSPPTSNGNGNGVTKSPPTSNGNSVTKDASGGNGNGTSPGKAPNGKGAEAKAAPKPAPGDDSASRGTTPPRTGAGAGRTGASQPRTPRKRRGR